MTKSQFQQSICDFIYYIKDRSYHFEATLSSISCSEDIHQSCSIQLLPQPIPNDNVFVFFLASTLCNNRYNTHILQVKYWKWQAPFLCVPIIFRLNSNSQSNLIDQFVHSCLFKMAVIFMPFKKVKDWFLNDQLVCTVLQIRIRLRLVVTPESVAPALRCWFNK